MVGETSLAEGYHWAATAGESSFGVPKLYQILSGFRLESDIMLDQLEMTQSLRWR